MNNIIERFWSRFIIGIVAILVYGGALPAQEQSVRPGINKQFENPNVERLEKQWEGESREIFAKRQEILAACKLKSGMVVADIGAGTGLFTRLFAKEVGSEGKVYAVDISAKFIQHIEQTCREQDIKNVTGIVCTADSAKLPPDSIDLAFICDVYHHFEFPFKTMASIHAALRPGGRVVIVDFKRIEGVSSPWTLNHVRAGQELVTKEIVSGGFKLIDSPDILKDNYCMVFQKLDAAQGGQENVRSFIYKKTPHGELAIYVHYPSGWTKDDKRPAIVFFFGGGWAFGEVKQFEPQARYLAGRGMVAFRADYRVKNRQGVTPDKCVEDAKSAIRWVRQNAAMLGVDPRRIVAAGGSAGGHIAACTALAEGLEAQGEDLSISSKPSALVLFNPVLRFEGVPQLSAMLKDDAKMANLLSPTLHLSKDTPPAILFYGAEDRLLAQGEEFIQRSKEAGNRAELEKAPGVAHGFFNKSPWQERTLKQADAFLESLGYVKGKPTMPEH